MTPRDVSSIGAPCWIDTFQPDPAAARDFYASLFGWSFDEPVPVSTGLEGAYVAARHEGRLVAGIGPAPTNGQAHWRTYVRVDDIDKAVGRVEAAEGTTRGGPVAVGRDGRLAAVSDATGVPFWLWESGTRAHAEVANEPGSWAMSSLHTTDLSRAQDFYGAVFDWQLDSSPHAPFSTWRLAGRVVAVAAVTDGVEVPPHWSVNFAVRDADVVARDATALGGRVLLGPFDTRGFRNTVLVDPQGAVIAASAPSNASGA